MRKGSHHSEGAKEKLKLFHSGKPLPLKVRKKIGDAHRGKSHSLIHRRRISDSLEKFYSNPENHGPMYGLVSPMKGRHHSSETKKKIGVAQSGEKHHMWGKHHSPETLRKIGSASLGRHPSLKTRELLSIRNSGENNPMFGRVVSPAPVDRINVQYKFITKAEVR